MRAEMDGMRFYMPLVMMLDMEAGILSSDFFPNIMQINPDGSLSEIKEVLPEGPSDGWSDVVDTPTVPSEPENEWGDAVATPDLPAYEVDKNYNDVTGSLENGNGNYTYEIVGGENNYTYEIVGGGNSYTYEEVGGEYSNVY